MKCNKLTVLLLGGLLVVLAQRNLSGQDAKAELKPDFCNLPARSSSYDGKVVTVRATYRYGFEWQEIYCLSCGDFGKTWLEIDENVLSKPGRKILKRFPKDTGTVNAVFTGRFESSGGPFGDGGYRFRLVLFSVADAKVITKSGGHLPAAVRMQVCGGDQSSAREGKRFVTLASKPTLLIHQMSRSERRHHRAGGRQTCEGRVETFDN